MVTRNMVRKNDYRDSIFLMRLAQAVQNTCQPTQVAVVMGTPLNKSMLQGLGLLMAEGETASANDMLVAIQADNEAQAGEALAELERLLSEELRPPSSGRIGDLQMALAAMPEANLALISVPGEYAAAEAEQALQRGLNVFIFSDNVSLQDERKLKEIAAEQGLLVMGPSCGLSLINGVALGICSRVRPGPVGIVGASGSGMQEIMALLDYQGVGVSHAIGVGGRDLSAEIGGLSMLQGLRMLAQDDATSVIVLVSKPPAQAVAQTIMAEVARCGKPTVICFLGSTVDIESGHHAVIVNSLAETAERATCLVKKTPFVQRLFSLPDAEVRAIVQAERARLQPTQRYIRGLFSGGTLAEQAIFILNEYVGDVHANTVVESRLRLGDPQRSRQHTVVDMGEEEFTRGRPHPAIDPQPLSARLRQEAVDPEVAVILFDVLLGYGAHRDPASLLAPAIAAAKEGAAQTGRALTVICSICGASQDPQNIELQKKQLRRVGAIVMPSADEAARLAGLIGHEGVYK